MLTVKTIVTHRGPHLDEMASIAFLRRFGSHLYPGVETAQLEFYDPVVHAVPGRTEQDWLWSHGVLFLGVGGFRYDDHPHERFPDHCVFTMVTDDAGFGNKPEWALLRQLVLDEDRGGADNRLHLAAMIKYAAAYAPRQGKSVGEAERAAIERIIQAVDLFLFDGFLPGQKQFCAACELLEHGDMISVANDSRGKPLRLFVLDGYEKLIPGADNREIARAARARLRVSLVIHRNTAGNVYVSAARRKGFGITRLDWLAARIRYLEQQRLNVPHVSDNDRLAADGMLHNWYHMRRGALLMNGSPTHPYVQRSLLLTETIVDLARTFLRSYRFYPTSVVH